MKNHSLRPKKICHCEIKCYQSVHGGGGESLYRTPVQRGHQCTGTPTPDMLKLELTVQRGTLPLPEHVQTSLLSAVGIRLKGLLIVYVSSPVVNNGLAANKMSLPYPDNLFVDTVCIHSFLTNRVH